MRYRYVAIYREMVLFRGDPRTCTLVCVRRKNDDGIQFIGAVEKLKKYRDAKIATLEADITEISSSDIRSRIRLGESVDSMIPKNVYDYITLNKLYQG